MSPEFNESSAFDQRSPERAHILANAPHMEAVAECRLRIEAQCESLMLKFGASGDEILKMRLLEKKNEELQTLDATVSRLDDIYEKIVVQTQNLEGAEKELANFRLQRELDKKSVPVDITNARLAELGAEYRRDQTHIITDGVKNLAAA